MVSVRCRMLDESKEAEDEPAAKDILVIGERFAAQFLRVFVGQLYAAKLKAGLTEAGLALRPESEQVEMEADVPEEQLTNVLVDDAALAEDEIIED